MTLLAKKDIRTRFQATARKPHDRRDSRRGVEDISAPLLHAEDALLSIVMRQNFDEQASMLFNQQLVQMSVAGDNLKNPALREQFRMRALQALGRLKPKAEKRLSQKKTKPSRSMTFKMDFPFI